LLPKSYKPCKPDRVAISEPQMMEWQFARRFQCGPMSTYMRPHSLRKRLFVVVQSLAQDQAPDLERHVASQPCGASNWLASNVECFIGVPLHEFARWARVCQDALCLRARNSWLRSQQARSWPTTGPAALFGPACRPLRARCCRRPSQARPLSVVAWRSFGA
jgi:hypothetical protein